MMLTQVAETLSVHLGYDGIGREQSLLEFGIVLAIIDGQLSKDLEGFAGLVSL